jgi:hypothetical protein
MSKPKFKLNAKGRMTHLCALLMAGIAALALVNCERSSSSSAPTVTKGQDRMSVVRFRQQGSAWVGRDGVTVEQPTGFVIRKAKGSTNGELIFAGLTSDGYWARHYGETPTDKWYTRSRYAVSLDGKFQSRPATEQQWSEAAEVSIGGRGLLPEETAAGDDDDIKYRGRSFKKSGQYWSPPSALFSQSERWVALFSYSSTEKPPRPEEMRGIPFPTLNHPPIDGFLDVYDTSTGEKILELHLPHVTASSTLLSTQALWVDDKYLVVPSGISLDACLLGILPNR